MANMSLEEAIKKPFSDWVKLVIGTVLGIIPIVQLIPIGYIMKNVRTPKEMPEFEYVADWLLGLKVGIVGFIYGIIIGILPALLLYLKQYTLSTIVAVILGIAAIPLLFGVTVEVAKSGNIGDGFKVSEIIKKYYTSHAITVLLGAIAIEIIYAIIALIIGIIPIIGTLIGLLLNFAGGVAAMSYIGANL